MIVTLTPAERSLGGALPSRRLEDWRWTDLSQRITTAYVASQNTPLADSKVKSLLDLSPLSELHWPRLVFINGQFVPEASTHKNFSDLKSGLVLDEPIIAMNGRASAQGAHLRLEKGAGPELVELLFITASETPRQVMTHNIIELERDAEVTLVETHVGQGDYLSNSVSEIRLGQGARLNRVKLQLEDAKATHLAHVHVSLAKGSTLKDLTLTLGAKLNRQNGTILLQGEGANATVAGAYLLRQQQHADTRLVVDHQVAACTSRELFKCVMDDAARGIFQGKVIVQRHAQKSDGKQSSHALLLSETAEFDAKPELEIYADDVVCGHGATAGDLNPDHLFYLESRGIPKPQARALLVAAFVGEVFETVDNDNLRQVLIKMSEQWLSEQGGPHA